jgi:WD40 repeat protein
MKKISLLILTLLSIFAVNLPLTFAQEYFHTRTLSGHKYSVSAVAFKDDSTLISVGTGSVLHSWNLDTGAQHWQAEVGLFLISDIAISPHDSRFVVYAGGLFFRPYIGMSYTDDGDIRGYLTGHTNTVNTLSFKPGSSTLASGSDDDTIRIWDLTWDAWKNKPVRTLRGHRNNVESVAWSPDGTLLASGSRDRTVRLWNPDNGANTAILRGHTNIVNSVAWSPDGTLLASASRDDTIRIWDPTNTNAALYVLEGHTGNVNTLAFHPTEPLLASGSSDNTIRLWDATTGVHKATLKGHTGSINTIAWNSDGSLLVSGSNDDTIRLWEPLAAVDITADGSVTYLDIIEVGENYGKTVVAGANPRADVNKDGIVDIEDLIVVAKAVDSQAPVDSRAAPMLAQNLHDFSFTVEDVQQWIQDAQDVGADSQTIAILERFLAVGTRITQPTPEKTVLLANYPNPFNPETWIPYQLAQPAEVAVFIHTANGALVRTLPIGEMPAGVYQSRARAAYWDGKNAHGEPVASGVYFYTLKAGQFTATRKMLIRK